VDDGNNKGKSLLCAVHFSKPAKYDSKKRLMTMNHRVIKADIIMVSLFFETLQNKIDISKSKLISVKFVMLIAIKNSNQRSFEKIT